MAVLGPNVRASSTSNTAVPRPVQRWSACRPVLGCSSFYVLDFGSALVPPQKRRTSWEIADEALNEHDNVRNWRPFGVRSEPLACVPSGAENNQPTVSMQSEVQSLFGSEGKFLVLVDAK